MKRKSPVRAVLVLLLVLLMLLIQSVSAQARPGTQGTDGAESAVTGPGGQPAEIVWQDGVRPAPGERPAPRPAPALEMVVREPDITLPPLDLAQLQPADATGPQRIGVARQLPEPVVIREGVATAGRWTQSDDSAIWRLTLAAEGARGLRLRVDNLSLPAGSELYIYDAAGTRAHGPLRRYGEALWTPTIFASAVTLELRVPGDGAREAVSLGVRELSHIYVSQTGLFASPAAPAAAGSCNLDVTCYSDWSNEAAAVALIILVKDGSSFGCTGTLLADFDGATFEEYFLTANHCLADSSTLGTQAVADTIDFFWFFQTSVCDGTPPSRNSVPQTHSGGVLLHRETRNNGNDVAFLRLREVPPAGVVWAGWTTSTPSSVTGIHHPQGEYKRISFGARTGSSTNYFDVVWSDGTTEPISSGSAIFDSNGRVTGQLWGGAASCDNQDGVDEYGRMSETYPHIARWMEIGGTINVDKSYTGTPELGTPTEPYDTVREGNDLAWDGVRLKVQGGNYPEAVTFTTDMLIIGENGTVTIGQ